MTALTHHHRDVAPALGLAVRHVIATGIPALDPSDVTVTRAVAS